MGKLTVILAGCLIFAGAGCESAGKEKALWEQNKQLMQEKTDLKTRAEKLQAENAQLREQIKVLAKLPSEAKLSELYNLEKVEIAKRSGIYEKDKGSGQKKLVVYVRPIDSEGDTLKAAGAVDVELWDLNEKPDNALLESWHIAPAELKKLWSDTLMTHYYRLTFDIDKQVAAKKELTVKVSFTDYLTGKIVSAQRVTRQ